MDKQIIGFLIRAKQATYAGKGAETVSSRVKSHDLVYREEDYMYYDTYLGGDKFAGEEALWISDTSMILIHMFAVWERIICWLSAIYKWWEMRA